MANRRFIQFFQTLHNKSTMLDAQFTVAATDSAGYGVTGFYGAGIQAVYMHTSATPAGAVNPANGYIQMNLQDNYNRLLGFEWSATPPVTGSSINISDSTVMTVGVPYQIVTLGTSTTANWVAAGVPVGTTPAVGTVFLAAITGAGTGTGTVKALGLSGVSNIELCGPNAQLSIGSKGAAVLGQANGSYLIFKCLAPTNSSTTTLIAAAPTAGAVIYMRLFFNNSAQGI